MFPEFYVSRAQEEVDSQEPVYYKVTSGNEDARVFWRNQGHERSKEMPLYDLLMEEKNGYGIERVERSETPWSDE